MNGVQTRLKCKPNVKRCKRFVFAAHSPLLHPNTLKTKAIIHFQTDHILTRFVFPPLYTSRPVEKEKVDIMLKAAMAAPSAVNKQPWAFIVIDDRDVLNKLAEVLPYAKMTAEAPMAIVVCGDLAKSLNGEFGKYWMLDCSAASENLLLAAEALELGAVWTAIYPEEQRIENVRKVLSLPEHIVPFNLIPIGYPQRNEEAKDKFKQENIHYNQW